MSTFVSNFIPPHGDGECGEGRRIASPSSPSPRPPIAPSPLHPCTPAPLPPCTPAPLHPCTPSPVND
ncbi:MAG TPA: hypothetical protein IGS52_09925 [Oscillatoriaceae cyanobacterium M33_DOE_052]|uniref:Uncharacterized protein n=1 Tax=Planktothricoides sp. SpSt-374 TaxID=2282167 RepID=A0A7C3ZLT7_9CYAN|nr:hypothetical protein [Oscillatoriaceae cyanobacterium M33_DOE_052]